MIDLGRYAAPVLAAYGVTLVLLAALIWNTIAANARARRALKDHDRDA